MPSKRRTARQSEPTPPKKERAKKTNGRAFIPTPQERLVVKIGAAAAIPDKVICKMIRPPKGISESTLRTHFREELDTGRATVIVTALSSLVAIAQNLAHTRCVTASIFLMKAMANWRDGSGLQLDASMMAGIASGKKKDDDEEGGGGDPSTTPVSFTLRIGEHVPTEGDGDGSDRDDD